MTNAFDSTYGAYYNVFYSEKDTRGEVDVLENIFGVWGKKVRRVADIGCGTGRHTAELFSRGYDVTGYDSSAMMLQIAHLTYPWLSLKRADVRELRTARKFQAVTMMFNVVGYMVTDSDVYNAFWSVSNALVNNGLFVFDFWDKKLVEKYPPQFEHNIYESEDGPVHRYALPISVMDSVVRTEYTITVPKKEIAASSWHDVRAFGVKEVKEWLGLAKMEWLATVDNQKERINSWTTMVVAKKT